jgi:Collagen triple helix repeat (20 copies)
MLSPLRNRFGIPGVIAVIALVFAMLGGAYAANNSGGSKATASAKGKPGPRGKTGKTGPAGPTGPQGPAGPAGAKGDAGAAGANGKDGSNGTNGANGANGKNAEAIPFAGSKGPIGGVTCTEGGLEVKSASATTLVCNGAKGTNGTNGTNGTTGFTETLPSGETETGSWAFGRTAAGVTELEVPISFAIPLTAELGGSLTGTSAVHYINSAGNEVILNEEFELEEIESTKCLGEAAAPTAVSGNLCVYAASAANATTFSGRIRKASSPGGEPGADTAGAHLDFLVTEGAGGNGTWAVTG